MILRFMFMDDKNILNDGKKKKSLKPLIGFDAW